MTDPLTRDQFNLALADAVAGVLAVYREVATMFREMATILREGSPSLTSIHGKALGPSAGIRNPDARYLRSYQAVIYGPVLSNDDPSAEADASDADEEDEDEEVESKRSIVVQTGADLVVVRASIFDRSNLSFEPVLSMATLHGCGAGPDLPAGTSIKLSRGRLRRALRAIDEHKLGKSTPVKTEVSASVVGEKVKRTLLVERIEPWVNYPLFDVTPVTLQRIASDVRSRLGPKPIG